jgi:hypothetical protein
MMRLAPMLLTLGLALTAGPTLAQDEAGDTSTMAGVAGIMFNTSISLNLPLTATDRAGKQAEEDGFRRDLYARSVQECALLLDSIAKTCTVTSVSVSTQVNSNPGQPDYLYLSSNIAMQVELK